VELLSGIGVAFEAALEEAEQAGVPVTEDEEQKEGDGEEVFRRDGVPDRPREVGTDGGRPWPATFRPFS
jgi:hypothetical protein